MPQNNNIQLTAQDISNISVGLRDHLMVMNFPMSIEAFKNLNDNEKKDMIQTVMRDLRLEHIENSDHIAMIIQQIIGLADNEYINIWPRGEVGGAPRPR